MIDEFLELAHARACLNAPRNYPDGKNKEFAEFENAAYLQGFSDALKLIAYLP